MPRRDDPLVFQLITHDSSCSECKRPLVAGNFLRKECEAGLCVECADLGHLVFVPSGDACVTRRASRHSVLRFVVVKWSRARKRYERQGILVQGEALARAEEECLADAELGEVRRAREAYRRAELDAAFVEAFARATRERYPNAPQGIERIIAEHACQRYSARIGRTAAAKNFDPQAIDLAIQAHVRHEHTRYDEILGGGIDRAEARAMVRREIDGILAEWKLRLDR